MRKLARLIATVGPVGSAPIAPASGASAIVVLVGFFLPVPPLWVALLLILACAAVGVWSANVAELDLGHDAKPIVIDEVVGQCLALLLVPHHPLAFFAAFVLFRVFDVWKPLGAREIQVLPGGWGVVADDVIAGLTACGTFHLGSWALHRLLALVG